MRPGQDDSNEDTVQAPEDITVEDDEANPWGWLDVAKYVDDSRFRPREPGEFTLREFIVMAKDIKRHITEVQARKILNAAIREGKMTAREWVNERGKIVNLYKEV